jgi:hypothetical protein
MVSPKIRKTIFSPVVSKTGSKMYNMHPLQKSDFKKPLINKRVSDLPTHESYETQPSSREDSNVRICEKLELSVEQWRPVFSGYSIKEKLG